VVFLLREHLCSLGLGKGRYWPLVAPIYTAAGILSQNGQGYPPDDLKFLWQRNYPRPIPGGVAAESNRFERRGV